MNNLIEITGILDKVSVCVEVINLTLILVISGQKYEFFWSDVDFENAGKTLAMLQQGLSQKISVFGDISNSKFEIRLAHSIIAIGPRLFSSHARSHISTLMEIGSRS
jgi:hypothetical protein